MSKDTFLCLTRRVSKEFLNVGFLLPSTEIMPLDFNKSRQFKKEEKIFSPNPMT